MKKLISLILTLAMLTAISPVVVNAEVPTGARAIVDIDFEDDTKYPAGVKTVEELKAMGIDAAKTKDIAEVSIVDVSDDAALNTDGHKKVLKFDPNSPGKASALNFPINYELNESEVFYVEYDWKYAPDTSDWEKGTLSDPFLGNLGTVDLVRIFTATGGNGALYEIYGRGVVNIRPFAEIQRNDNGYYVSEWLHTKQKYDYGAYLEDTSVGAKNGGAVIETTRIKNGTSLLSTDFNIQTLPSGNIVIDLTFDNSIGEQGKGCIYIDNVKVYAVKKMAYVSSTMKDGTKNVYAEGEDITLTYTNEIGDASGLTIKSGSQALAKSKYDLKLDKNTVTISFKQGLGYNKIYTIDPNGVTDKGGQAANGAKSFSFTTEQTPDVLAETAAISIGLGDTMTSSDTLSKNSLGGASIVLTNNKSKATKATVIFVEYRAEDGKIAQITKSTVTVPANGEKTVMAGLKLSDAGKVKVYVWDDMENMSPYVGHLTIDVK